MFPSFHCAGILLFILVYNVIFIRLYTVSAPSKCGDQERWVHEGGGQEWHGTAPNGMRQGLQVYTLGHQIPSVVNHPNGNWLFDANNLDMNSPTPSGKECVAFSALPSRGECVVQCVRERVE